MPKKKAPAKKSTKRTATKKKAAPARKRTRVNVAKAPAKKAAQKKRPAAKKKSAVPAARRSATKRTAAAKKAKSSRKATNKKAPKKQRVKASRARTATCAEEEDGLPLWLPTGVQVKRLLALLLLPICYATTQAFFAISSSALRGELWQSTEFWSFILGAIGFVFAFFSLERPVTLYVFGHEATHAVFAFLCGGDVKGFKFSRDGGYIYTTKSNTLISLAPYLVPFYTLIILAVAVFATMFFDVYAYHEEVIFGLFGFSWIWLLMAAVGLSWSFHICFTVWMIRNDQPDLVENGVYFSVILIYLANVLALCAFVLIGSETIGVGDFINECISSLKVGGDILSKAMTGLVWLGEKIAEIWR